MKEMKHTNKNLSDEERKARAETLMLKFMKEMNFTDEDNEI